MDIENFKIELDKNSIQLLKISDEEYFSEKYSHYISNSKLKLINPLENGSIELFLSDEKNEYNPSLEFGTAIHQLILQSNDYKLLDYNYKPSGKLGSFIESLVKYRKLKYKIWEAATKASDDSNYYKNKLTIKLFKNALKNGLKYYLDLYYNKLKSNDNKENIIVPNNILESVKTILKSYDDFEYKYFTHSKNSYNEYAIFVDFIITINEEKIIIPFKLKIDNFYIDDLNKSIILNDIKTTSNQVDFFMGYKYYDEFDEVFKGYLGSFQKLHYYRQLAIYIYILQQVYGPDYKYYTNIIAISSKNDCSLLYVPIQNAYIKKGLNEFKELLYLVAKYKLLNNE